MSKEVDAFQELYDYGAKAIDPFKLELEFDGESWHAALYVHRGGKDRQVADTACLQFDTPQDAICDLFLGMAESG